MGVNAKPIAMNTPIGTMGSVTHTGMHAKPIVTISPSAIRAINDQGTWAI